MANKTYLELVNEVLVRLREPEVSAVTDTAYSKIIGHFVNDAKRQVEDAYDWNSLKATIAISAVANTYNYTLTGSGQRFRTIDVLHNADGASLHYENTPVMDKHYLNNPITGKPDRYNFKQEDTNGDTKVNLYPIPDASYTINFNIIKPQTTLSASADQIKVPSEPVIFLAYAKALSERGEDNGINSNEAYLLFKQSLSDHISIEASRYPNETTWVSV